MLALRFRLLALSRRYFGFTLSTQLGENLTRGLVTDAACCRRLIRLAEDRFSEQLADLELPGPISILLGPIRFPRQDTRATDGELDDAYGLVWPCLRHCMTEGNLRAKVELHQVDSRLPPKKQGHGVEAIATCRPRTSLAAGDLPMVDIHDR